MVHDRSGVGLHRCNFVDFGLCASGAGRASQVRQQGALQDQADRTVVLEFFLPIDETVDEYTQGLRVEEAAKQLVNNVKMRARWAGLQVSVRVAAEPELSIRMASGPCVPGGEPALVGSVVKQQLASPTTLNMRCRWLRCRAREGVIRVRGAQTAALEATTLGNANGIWSSIFFIKQHLAARTNSVVPPILYLECVLGLLPARGESTTTENIAKSILQRSF